MFPIGVRIAVAISLLLVASRVWSQQVPGSMDVHWNEGAADCATSTQDPIQVHRYESQTLILRTNLCKHFEANFVYLLVGSKRALLIDTGPVADPKEVPLARTVLKLFPLGEDNSSFPLLVVHTHEHRDHWAGDSQFASLPSVQVVSADFEKMRAFFEFNAWPNAIAQIELGDRLIDVIPTLGHTSAHVAYYDERTGLLFSGDFLLPGRLTIENTDAYRESAKRASVFARDHPVRYILGSHIELDSAGALYDAGSHYHPNEHALQLSQDDIGALQVALEEFNGFYAKYPDFVLTHPLHNLLALMAATGVGLLIIGLIARHYLKGRRRK